MFFVIHLVLDLCTSLFLAILIVLSCLVLSCLVFVFVFVFVFVLSCLVLFFQLINELPTQFSNESQNFHYIPANMF